MQLRSLPRARLCRTVALSLALGVAATSVMAAPPGHQDANPDWPCLQHKVATLTAAQMWDGPPVEGLAGWNDDAEMRKLIPVLASRRVPLDEARADIAKFAEKQPEADRDRKLTLLFAGLLDRINTDRSSVVNGIERYERRQKSRADQIEREGAALAKLRQQATQDEKARAELATAEDAYNWDVRVFQDRQQSIPVACEIPVLIEQRIYELAREIRSHMKS